MTRVLICGAGKVGVATAAVFSQFPDYDVYLADNQFDDLDVNQWLQKQAKIRTIAIDVKQTESLIEYCKKHAIDVIVSTLVAGMNKSIIETAIACQIHYVDCSPKIVDIDEQKHGDILNSKSAFLPNCGLAPGWTGIIANAFMQQMEEAISCQVQVGVIADEMTHSLSGSAKRFIHELTEYASIIEQGRLIQRMPLSEVSMLQIDGRTFETTHAANGYGHLMSLWQNKASNLVYQTLMPVGMAEKIQFLIQALRLHEQAENMRQLLASVFNRQPKDALWVRIKCTGKSQSLPKTLSFKQVIQPISIAHYQLSSLQISTAIGIASVVDMICQSPHRYQGLIAQETLDFQSWLSNRFTQLLIKQDSFNHQQEDQSSLLNTTL
ncbi:saccharopine dehydrogenase family protein [Legionella sp. W05-934-2]|uniref:saccharopine dehydrogenase family protein n=1 Tax=Legionella sp. W05-934-2 TaxID=1198649 RepID=UPI00346196EF